MRSRNSFKNLSGESDSAPGAAIAPQPARRLSPPDFSAHGFVINDPARGTGPGSAIACAARARRAPPRGPAPPPRDQPDRRWTRAGGALEARQPRPGWRGAARPRGFAPGRSARPARPGRRGRAACREGGGWRRLGPGARPPQAASARRPPPAGDFTSKIYHIKSMTCFLETAGPRCRKPDLAADRRCSDGDHDFTVEKPSSGLECFMLVPTCNEIQPTSFGVE
jgi:hypothetical protein